MKIKLWVMAAAVLCAAPSLVRAEDAASTSCKEDKNGDIVCPWDNGPDSIDVSSYPEKTQKLYKTFAFKCSKCHTLARPINSPLALPQEWKDYVTKMMHKKRSGIDEDSAAKIIEFLAYDSSVRKKDIIAKKLSEKKEGKPDASSEKPAAKSDKKTAGDKAAKDDGKSPQ